MNDQIQTSETGTKEHPVKVVNGRTKNLSVPLTDKEKGAKGDVVAHLVHKILAKKEEKKNQGAQLKSEIDELESELKRVSLEISTGVVYRDVPIREEHNYRLGTYREVRLDTDQVINERPLTAAERQPELPLGDGGSGGGEDESDDAADAESLAADQAASAAGRGTDDDIVVDDDHDPTKEPEPELPTRKNPKGKGGKGSRKAKS